MATKSQDEEPVQQAETKSPELLPNRKRHLDTTASKEQDTGDKVSDNLGTGEPDRKVRKSTTKSESQETPDLKENPTDDKQSASGSNEKIVPDLGPFVVADQLSAECGDLIEIQRGFYSHWGLYASDGNLIHVTGNGTDIAVKEADCQKKTVSEVAGVSMVRVNNLLKQAHSKNRKAFDPEVILKKAEANVGKVVPYDLVSKNCEHYVTEWRYGEGWSSQVDVGLSLISKSTEALFGVLAQSLEKGDKKEAANK